MLLSYLLFKPLRHGGAKEHKDIRQEKEEENPRPKKQKASYKAQVPKS
jgi:hypothetical protein